MKYAWWPRAPDEQDNQIAPGRAAVRWRRSRTSADCDDVVQGDPSRRRDLGVNARVGVVFQHDRVENLGIAGEIALRPRGQRTALAILGAFEHRARLHRDPA